MLTEKLSLKEDEMVEPGNGWLSVILVSDTCEIYVAVR